MKRFMVHLGSEKSNLVDECQVLEPENPTNCQPDFHRSSTLFPVQG